jgi:hypothetical protein
MFEAWRRKKRYRCAVCGGEHDDLPAVASNAPAQYDWATEEERAANFELTTDTCVWNNEHFFIRSVLELPFSDRDGTFSFGVWSTLSEANFKLYLDAWDRSDRGAFETMFGWFSNQLPGYPETVGLACQVQPRSDGLRPVITLEPTNHPLAQQQAFGISFDEAVRYVHEHLGI